jgi:hypothetical protein
VGSEIKRIEKEFILKDVHEKRTALEIHLAEERLQAYIERFDAERLVLVLPDDILPPDLTELTVFFRFRNNPMTFTSKVLQADEGKIEIAQPDELFRDLTRSFERIKSPRGVSVTFLFKGKQIRLDYPDSDQYDPVEAPEPDPGFDPTKIADLMKTFRERAGRFSSENKIVMLRERIPTSFQEKLVAKTGKIVTFPFYPAEAQIRSAEVRDRILSQDEIIKHEAEEGEDMFSVLERIGKIIDSNREKKIWHELYCPILYHQYVVGYLYLMRSGSEQEKFESGTFDFVLEYSRILAYSLKANGYFRAEPIVDEFGSAELIDISGSGLLFSYPPDGPEILLYTDLDLRIRLGEQTIPVRGRVMRSHNDADRVYIAIQFIELDPDDMEILFEHIYGREYRGDVDSVGVADPANLPLDEM